MISVFAPNNGLTVYCSPCWWGEDWNPLDYGVDFDPEKPFMLQVRELLSRVPVMNLYGLYTTLVNSDYTNMVAFLKNCYMVTYSDYCENAIYGSFVNHSKDCVDNLMSEQNELCYETTNCAKCYKTFFSEDCEECTDVYFSKNCVGSNNLFGCVNLKGKSNYIFNEPVSREEFEIFVKNNTQTRDAIEAVRERVVSFWRKFPQKYIHGVQNVQSTGDYLRNSKNAIQCYCGADIEDSKYCSFVTAGGLKDSYDFTNFGTVSSLLYEVVQGGNQTSQVRFSWFAITNALNVDYSMFIVGSKNIFGSIGLRKKEYCILNKQYTKEGYEKLREQIRDHMSKVPYKDRLGREYAYGEFFPSELSPFGYNETTAQEFFPLAREAAEANGFNWRDLENREYRITSKPRDLSLANSTQEILEAVIGCDHDGRCEHQCSSAFRIIPQELDFYHSLNVPLPLLCPNCRHGERLARRNTVKLWERGCLCEGSRDSRGVYENTGKHFHGEQRCPNTFQTSYAPDRLEIVYCEQCYNPEVA